MLSWESNTIFDMCDYKFVLRQGFTELLMHHFKRQWTSDKVGMTSSTLEYKV